MKGFLKILIALVPMLLIPQLLGLLIYHKIEDSTLGALLVYYLAPVFAMAYLIDIGCKRPPSSLVPLAIGWACGMLLIFDPPSTQKGCFLLILGEIAAIIATAIWATFEKKAVKKIIAVEEEKLRKEAFARLRRFKNSTCRQYIVVSDADAKDLLETIDMEEDGVLYQLPDGRHLIILKQPRKPEDFEDLLDFFRSDGDGVIGYIDNPNSHKCFVEEDMEEVPFDFSLLEKAVPVVDLLL